MTDLYLMVDRLGDLLRLSTAEPKIELSTRAFKGDVCRERGNDEPATVPAKKSIRGSRSFSIGCWFAVGSQTRQRGVSWCFVWLMSWGKDLPVLFADSS